MIFISYATLALRILLGLALLILSLPFNLFPAFNLDTVWPITLASGLGILFHVLVDLTIGGLSNTELGKETEKLTAFRMETERDLTNGLIVASGVVIGLVAKGSGGMAQAGIVFLAIGIIVGFISLSVLGGSVETEQGGPGGLSNGEGLKVKVLHHTIFMIFLNLQFVAFIIGIAMIA
jgi:hypothetical protein